MTENEKLDLVILKLDSLQQDVDALKKESAATSLALKNQQLTLENQIGPSIQRVAEGHLDLSRQLKEAVKSNQEFEMLSVRVSMLEADVRLLKQQQS